MIKANELRIGNWVSVKTGNHIHFHRILALEERNVKLLNYPLMRLGEERKGLIEYENILPIRLEDDLLIKIGFSKRDLPFNFCNGANGFQIPIKASAKRYLLICKSGAFILENNSITDMASCGLHFYDLHQIQNLYYLLTNEELEIKL